eukprot:PhM_4_TR15897/c0_g1_i1/m.72124
MHRKAPKSSVGPPSRAQLQSSTGVSLSAHNSTSSLQRLLEEHPSYNTTPDPALSTLNDTAGAAPSQAFALSPPPHGKAQTPTRSTGVEDPNRKERLLVPCTPTPDEETRRMELEDSKDNDNALQTPSPSAGPRERPPVVPTTYSSDPAHPDAHAPSPALVAAQLMLALGGVQRDRVAPRAVEQRLELDDDGDDDVNNNNNNNKNNMNKNDTDIQDSSSDRHSIVTTNGTTTTNNTITSSSTTTTTTTTLFLSSSPIPRSLPHRNNINSNNVEQQQGVLLDTPDTPGGPHQRADALFPRSRSTEGGAMNPQRAPSPRTLHGSDTATTRPTQRRADSMPHRLEDTLSPQRTTSATPTSTPLRGTSRALNADLDSPVFAAGHHRTSMSPSTVAAAGPAPTPFDALRSLGRFMGSVASDLESYLSNSSTASTRAASTTERDEDGPEHPDAVLHNLMGLMGSAGVFSSEYTQCDMWLIQAVHRAIAAAVPNHSKPTRVVITGPSSGGASSLVLPVALHRTLVRHLASNTTCPLVVPLSWRALLSTTAQRRINAIQFALSLFRVTMEALSIMRPALACAATGSVLAFWISAVTTARDEPDAEPVPAEVPPALHAKWVSIATALHRCLHLTHDLGQFAEDLFTVPLLVAKSFGFPSVLFVMSSLSQTVRPITLYNPVAPGNAEPRLFCMCNVLFPSILHHKFRGSVQFLATWDTDEDNNGDGDDVTSPVDSLASLRTFVQLASPRVLQLLNLVSSSAAAPRSPSSGVTNMSFSLLGTARPTTDSPSSSTAAASHHCPLPCPERLVVPQLDVVVGWDQLRGVPSAVHMYMSLHRLLSVTSSVTTTSGVGRAQVEHLGGRLAALISALAAEDPIDVAAMAPPCPKQSDATTTCSSSTSPRRPRNISTIADTDVSPTTTLSGRRKAPKQEKEEMEKAAAPTASSSHNNNENENDGGATTQPFDDNVGVVVPTAAEGASEAEAAVEGKEQEEKEKEEKENEEKQADESAGECL